MLNLKIASAALGWGFYAIAESTPLFDSVGVFAALPPNFHPSDFPLGWLAYDIMFDKPLLMLAAVPALFFLFLSFSYLEISPIERTFLGFVTTWSVFLAIPDMVWPLGTIYYETLKYYFGVLGLFLAFVSILFYCYCVWASRWRDNQS